MNKELDLEAPTLLTSLPHSEPIHSVHQTHKELTAQEQFQTHPLEVHTQHKSTGRQTPGT